MRKSLTHLFGASVALILVVATGGEVLAQSPERVLNVAFPETGQVCLSAEQVADVTRDIKKMVLPPGSAITLVAFSDKTEIAGRRFEEQPPCVKRAIPAGIGNHERIALMRALQVAEIAKGLGLTPFAGTPLLVLGNPSYRHAHSEGFAVVAERSVKSGPNERRVEVWARPAANLGGHPGDRAGGDITVLTPILLPPSGYAGGGQAGDVTVAQTTKLSDETGQTGWQWLGWSMVSSGVALAIAGGFVYHSADNMENRSREELDRGRSITFQDRADGLYRDAGWSIGVGSGLALLGGVLLVSLPGTPDEASLSLGPAPMPGGGFGMTVGVQDLGW